MPDAIGGRIIARETISALRKDVTAKYYGGDITRKRKLRDSRRPARRRRASSGRVDIPQEAFISALKMDGWMRANQLEIRRELYGSVRTDAS